MASVIVRSVHGVVRQHLLVAAAVGLPLLLAAGLAYQQVGLGQLEPLDDFGSAPAFKLIDQEERPVTSEQFRGKIVVANFVYTNCKDICPLLTRQMRTLQEELRRTGLLGSQVHLLSFTVDPARDTPAVLRAYAARYQADPSAWRFLTGREDEVVPLIVEGFHLGVEALPPRKASPERGQDAAVHEDSYEVMHSPRFVLIDRQWHVRAYYDGREFDLERVMRAIRQLLR